MKKHASISFLALFILLGAQSCATMNSGSAATSAAISAAEAEIKAAKSAGNEWRDSTKILDKAKAALNAGDTEKANKLIAAARKQGIDAQIQAMDQLKVNGPQ